MTGLLLAVIVLILLFGAGVVKGWIRGALVLALGTVLLCAFALAVIQAFGQTAFWYLFFGLGALLFVGSLWARSQER